MSQGHGKRTRRSGFTLVEVALAVTILLVALMAMSASTLRMNSLRRQNRERSVAQNMVRVISENIHSVSEAAILDDPTRWSETIIAALSPGGELGNTFNVTELAPQNGQATVGTIQVVIDETQSDLVLGFEMGMPRDLNGDGDANDNDVTPNARILPVIVTARWTGVTGDVTITHPFYVIGY